MTETMETAETTETFVKHGNFEPQVVVTDGEHDLKLATHISFSESDEGAFLYFGTIVAPSLWDLPNTPTANLHTVAKIFLPRPTLIKLKAILAAPGRE